MPLKRTRSTRASTRQSAVAQPAPPSSEDAKPNVDQLNAEAEAELQAQAGLPSSPPDPTSELSKPPFDPQPEQQFDAPPEPQFDPQPEPQLDLQSESQPGRQPEPQSEPRPEPENVQDQPIVIDEASTSTAPPARRLDTLGPSRGRGKKPVLAPRFAGRRSQAKREQLEKEEQRRKDEEAKAAEEAAKAKREAEAREASGRARGRGRGRGRGRHDDGRQSPVASGPFSAGQVSKEIQQKNKRWSHRGSGWKGWQVTGNKESTRGGRAKGKAAQNADAETKPKLDANGDISMEDGSDDNDFASSDDEEFNGQRRMNVEKLGVIDLAQDDDTDLNQFAPIRIARVAHRERGFGVREDHAVKKEPDAAVKVDTIQESEVIPRSKSNDTQEVVRDLEIASEATGFQAVYSDTDSDSNVRIKSEPELDNASTKQNKANGESSSPEKKYKGKGKGSARTFSNNTVEDYDEEVEIDREEEQRRQNDLDLLRTELGNGDAVMSNSDAAERRAEKVYLFQFPPLLPDLEPIHVKTDPDAVNGDDVMQLDAPSNSSKPITINDDGKGEQPKLPSGAVGKMRVHASGKVTMDWGGVALTLGVGGKADFLQTVVAATFPDTKKDDPAATAFDQAGQAINLGHVKEKFVVTPDWEELLG